MKIQSTPQYIPSVQMDRTTGKLYMKDVNWTELAQKARVNRDKFQSGGVYGNTVDPYAPGGLEEVLPSGEVISHPTEIVKHSEYKYSMRGNEIIFWAPGPGCIFSGGGDGQSAYIEYTADSTADDPIVRISGRSKSGEGYIEIVHLKDIDPHNATYPEMCALLAHQKCLDGYIYPNGMSKMLGEGDLKYQLPITIDPGDYTQRRDYMALLQEDISGNADRGSAELSDWGKQILEYFEKFIEQRKKHAEDEKLDELLGISHEKEGFWEARARRQEEFQELQVAAARKRRILQRLQSGEPVSAAELLLGMM